MRTTTRTGQARTTAAGAARPGGAPRDVRALLTFIVAQEGKPRFESAALTGGEPRALFASEQREVVVEDARRALERPSLDREGFALVRHATCIEDFYDFADVEARYGPELERMLTQVTRADRAAVFDYTRRSDARDGAANRDGLRRPATRAHVDYTLDSGPMRARDALGADEFDRVLASGGRIVQVNVWRPIEGPVRRAPLALADASSVRPAELVATDHVFPDRVGEIYQVAYAPQQRWYWFPRMQRDEVVLIKGWDSLDDGRARFTPHAAFDLGDPDAPARESIEARTYLVFDC